MVLLSAQSFLLCRLFRVRRVSSITFPTSTLTLVAERAHADWEYFTLAPYIKPHLVSDGNGAYELIVTVSSRIVICHWMPDHVLLSLTRGTYRHCLIHARQVNTRTQLMTCLYRTRHWKDIGSFMAGRMTK